MYEVTRGVPQPLGATPDATGVNFSVYSESAYYVELLLFDRHDSPTPSHVIRLDPDNHRSFHFWHCHVAGVRPGQIYAFRADGPRDTEHGGFRFNPHGPGFNPARAAAKNSSTCIACHGRVPGT